MSFIEVFGYIPAIVFPGATIIQLVHLYKSKNSDGVSALSWAAFMLGNLSLYIYTEKYTQLQSIIGLLLTSVLQLVIIAMVIKYRKKESSKTESLI